jgi:hypothetical protein
MFFRVVFTGRQPAPQITWGRQVWQDEDFCGSLTSESLNFAFPYHDNEMLKKQPQTLANAQGFAPGLDEALPGGFAAAERQAEVDYLNGTGLDSVLNQVTAAQKQALGK